MNYNKLAKKYDQLWEPDKYLLKEYRDIMRGITAKNILDLGCGTGSFFKELNIQANITGIDKSREMLKEAKKRFPKIHFIEGDIRITKTEGLFDIIICTYDTINHLLQESDWKQLFKNVKSQLAPDGYFLFDAHTSTKMENLKKESPFRIGETLIEIISSGKNKYTWKIKLNNENIEVKQYTPENKKIVKLAKEVFSSVKFKSIFDKESKTKDGRLIYICQ